MRFLNLKIHCYRTLRFPYYRFPYYRFHYYRFPYYRFSMQHKSADGKKEEVKSEEPAAAPVFISLEAFTVNLQPDPDEKFLQMEISLQVANAEQAELLKTQMPAVRNRLLMLLTSKLASDISTSEGKQKLSEEISAEIKKPFYKGAKPQEVLGVFFTSFVIQ